MNRLGTLLIAISILIPATGLATGFMIFEHGAASTGMGDARTAVTGDLGSSLFFNPSSITEIPGFQLQLGFTGVLPYTSYRAAGNPAEPRTYVRLYTGEEIVVNDGLNDRDAKIKGFTPIHIHASYNFEDIGITAGFSVYNPYGLGLYWPGDWDGRFLATESDMVTFFLQPVIAMDIAKIAGFKSDVKLSVSLGYDLILASAILARRIDLRVGERLLFQDVEGAEGEMKLTGDAISHAMIASLYAEIPGLFAIGACVRFGLKPGGVIPLPFEGTGKFWFNEAGERVLSPNGLNINIPAETNGKVTLNLPKSMNFGIAYLGIENLVIDVDFFYAFYESYKELKLEYDCIHDPDPCDLQLDPLVANWHNSWQLSVGAEYWLTDAIVLRAGYAYVTTPIPDDTLDPMLPDGKKNLGTIGFGYQASWWRFDVGYMLSIWTATKDNEIGTWDQDSPAGMANGDYDSYAHLLALTYTLML